MTDENKAEERPKAISKSAWAKKRIHEGVTLPSGAVVDLILPDLPQMAKGGTIPTELLEASAAMQKSIEGKEQLTVEQLTNVAGLQEFLLPLMLVNPKITGEDVASIPAEDKEALLGFANRAKDIDAVGRHLAGLETLSEWRTFRSFDLAVEGMGG